MYLWCFSLLYSHSVKTLDEVVQHLCLLAVLNGEVVTAGIGNTGAARASHTLKHTRRRNKALGPVLPLCSQIICELLTSSVNLLMTPSHHTHGSIIKII